MMRRLLHVLGMLMICAATINAQRPRIIRTGDPGMWITGSIAGLTGTEVNDGRSGSRWYFGNSTNWQYRASIEKGMANASSFGLAGAYARIPFVYSSSTGVPLPGNITGVRCASCDAHLDMMSLVATFHSGGGYGFHQVIELNGGIVAYQNLKRDSDGAKLAPGGGNIDPLFSIGYGIGFGLSDKTQIEFIPEYAIALHERSGVANGVSNTNSMRSLRITARMGFGGRSIRR